MHFSIFRESIDLVTQAPASLHVKCPKGVRYRSQGWSAAQPLEPEPKAKPRAKYHVRQVPAKRGAGQFN